MCVYIIFHHMSLKSLCFIVNHTYESWSTSLHSGTPAVRGISLPVRKASRWWDRNLGAMQYASNLKPNCQKVDEKISKSFPIALKIILTLSHRLRFFSSFSRPHSPRYGTRSYSGEALIGVTPCLHGSTPHASQHAIHQLLTVQELLGERVD